MEENRNNAVDKAEEVMAENRLQNAREREHIKAEKQKAKASRLREKNRKKAERKERKIKIAQDKKAKRELRKQNSQNENKSRKKTKNGGYIAAIVSLSIATVVLASVLTCNYLMPSDNDKMLEASYNKAFYDTVEQVENIDLNLSKILATKDSGAMQKYLVDTAINSELAENDLQSLPLKDESKFYTTKLVNQIGDYSKYLNNKIINGENLTKEDYESLRSLYSANVTLKNSLQKMVKEMGNDYSFSEMASGAKDMIVESFDELQNLSVKYPELIYDGPFSDGVNQREIKGVSGREITSAEAKDIFAKLFKDYGVKDITYIGETKEHIPCFNVQGMIEKDVIFAQISKKGGKLIMFEYAGDCMDVNYDKTYAEEKAQNFLTSLGINDMKAVWMGLENNVYTYNFAYEQEGIICYSDLIKVRICADSGKILGMEASSYYANHVVREIGSASISKATAKSNLADTLNVETSRLVIIPIGTRSEKLCYEFSGEQEGAIYYVYIDAVTGRQVEMFKVVESTEGELLM